MKMEMSEIRKDMNLNIIFKFIFGDEMYIMKENEGKRMKKI